MVIYEHVERARSAAAAAAAALPTREPRGFSCTRTFCKSNSLDLVLLCKLLQGGIISLFIQREATADNTDLGFWVKRGSILLRLCVLWRRRSRFCYCSSGVIYRDGQGQRKELMKLQKRTALQGSTLLLGLIFRFYFWHHSSLQTSWQSCIHEFELIWSLFSGWGKRKHFYDCWIIQTEAFFGPVGGIYSGKGMKLPRERQKIWTGNKGKRLEKRFGASLTQLALLLTRSAAAFSYFFFCFIKFGKTHSYTHGAGEAGGPCLPGPYFICGWCNRISFRRKGDFDPGQW